MEKKLLAALISLFEAAASVETRNIVFPQPSLSTCSDPLPMLIIAGAR
ncbi:MAG TPA: hypothetical protein VH519_07830 [Hyphomicrobiaceae bacterium]